MNRIILHTSLGALIFLGVLGGKRTGTALAKGQISYDAQRPSYEQETTR